MMFRILTSLIIMTSSALAGDVLVKAPEEVKVQSAEATAPATKSQSPGIIEGSTIRFLKLLPQTKYDLQATLADGTILQGVDMGWYNDEPPADKPEEMTDDDREQIRAIVQDVVSFYNKSHVLLTRGDHDRATLLVQLIRDNAFHSDKGGEVIWHIELWYFKNQHGGWEKIAQQNKLLRRERFKSQAQFKAIADKIKWIADLGGIMLSKPDEKRQITLPPDVILKHATTAPADSP